MYFNNVKTIEELKREYRKLCKTMHPDHGGNAVDFVKMKNEYDSAVNFLKTNKVARPAKPAKYEEWKVIRYTTTGPKWREGLELSEIVEVVRQYIVENYSTLKFSFETGKTSFKILLKECISALEKIRIKNAIKRILEEYNKIDIVRYPDVKEEYPLFKFFGIEEDFEEPMEDWQYCGYTANWSLYY